MQAGINALIVFILAVLTVMFGLYGYYGSLNPCEMLAKEIESDLIRDSSINSSVDMLHARLEARLTVSALADGQCLKAILRSRDNSYRDQSRNKRRWNQILGLEEEDEVAGPAQDQSGHSEPIQGEEPR